MVRLKNELSLHFPLNRQYLTLLMKKGFCFLNFSGIKQVLFALRSNCNKAMELIPSDSRTWLF